MKKMRMALSALFFLQCLLSVLFLWQSFEVNKAPVKIFSFDKNNVERIEIRGQSAALEISHVEGQWVVWDVVSQFDAIPASTSRVVNLLSALQEIEATWPVAKTMASQKRFEVAQDAFQKHVKIYVTSQDEPIEFFVGTSPGLRKSHVRLVQSKEIYALPVNVHELSLALDDWLDKKALSLGEVHKINGPDFSLSKENEVWGFSSKTDQKLDLERLEEFLSGFRSFCVQGLAQELPKGEPIVFELVDAFDQVWTYRFYSDGEKNFVLRDDRDTPFLLRSFDYEKFAKFSFSHLVHIPQFLDMVQQYDDGANNDG